MEGLPKAVMTKLSSGRRVALSDAWKAGDPMDCEGPCKLCRGGSPPFSLLLLEVSVGASDPKVRARGRGGGSMAST